MAHRPQRPYVGDGFSDVSGEYESCSDGGLGDHKEERSDPGVKHLAPLRIAFSEKDLDRPAEQDHHHDAVDRRRHPTREFDDGLELWGRWDQFAIAREPKL